MVDTFDPQDFNNFAGNYKPEESNNQADTQTTPDSHFDNADFNDFASNYNPETAQQIDDEDNKTTEVINNKLGLLKYAPLQYDLTELNNSKVDLMKKFNNGELTIEDVKQRVGSQQEALKTKYGVNNLEPDTNNPATFIFGQAFGQVPNIKDVSIKTVPWAALTIPATMIRNQGITATMAAIGSVIPGVGTAAGAGTGETIATGEAVVEGLKTASNIATFVDTAEKEGYGFYYDAVVDKGLDPKEAAKVSTIVGLVNGSAELISLNAVLGPFAKLGKGIVGKSSKEVLQESTKGLNAAMKTPAFKEAVATFAKQMGKTVGAEVSTEEIQEIVSILGETNLGEKSNKDEIIQRLQKVGLSAGAASLVFGAFYQRYKGRINFFYGKNRGRGLTYLYEKARRLKNTRRASRISRS